MVAIPTTSGDVELELLGRTMVHEHVRVGSEGMRKQWPHLFDEQADLRQAIAKVQELQRFNVDTICDPACMDLNRDVHLNLAVARATGVRFVMATGVYGAHWASLPVFMRGKLDLLVECFVHDIRVGIQGTDVRAAFIKCAADYPGMTDDIEMVHRASAAAALETGVSVMAHSNPATGIGLEQMKLFLDEGLPPERIQIARAGDTDDLDVIERLLDTGCYIGMDRYGLHLATDRRNNTVAALVERGYGDRMMLGHDSCAVMDGRDEPARLQKSPDNHLTFIFDQVVPDLLNRGVGLDQVDAMFGQNVHRWLAGGRVLATDSARLASSGARNDGGTE